VWGGLHIGKDKRMTVPFRGECEGRLLARKN
jgi:hypothetical protein